MGLFVLFFVRYESLKFCFIFFVPTGTFLSWGREEGGHEPLKLK